MIDLTTLSFERPWVLLLIIPMFIFYLYYINKNITRQEHLPRGSRALIILTKTIITGLLLLALSGPHTYEQDVTTGDPTVTILIDNSSSMHLFNQEEITTLEENLQDLVEVHTTHLGTSSTSNIGDSVLNSLEHGGSILLISDGNNNYGTTLSDVALQAAKINTSINTLALTTINQDSSISIIGPDKVSSEVEAIFKIIIQSTQPEQARHITITLDGETILDENTKQKEFIISKVFFEGYHTLTASIAESDYFPENNIYYKNVKVIPKPVIVYYTQKESPLTPLLTKLYQVHTFNNLETLPPETLAVITNDIPAEQLEIYQSTLRTFVTEGNGLAMIGGQNSYEQGNYQGSSIETLLPVIVGAAEPEGEKTNLIIAMDISKSTSQAFGEKLAEDVEKALALSAIDNVNDESNVGFIAFNTQPYTVSELTPLGPKKEELKKKIRSLIDIGNTYIPVGIKKSINMLEGTTGGKNIVIISDGKSGGFGLAASLVQQANDQGIKVYLIGVGYDERPTDHDKQVDSYRYGQQYLKDVSKLSGGTYFRGNEAPQRINILFGDPERNPEQRSSYTMILLDKNHFITQDLENTPEIYGYNQVLPKTTARLLATTDAGNPLITVWRYGLGRIAALTTDDGTAYAGQLISNENSIIITRMINWLIGDPERNVQRYISIPDTYLNETTTITAKQENIPEATGITFYKVDNNLYQATIIPQNTGIQELLGARYAVNYAREYENIGINPELETIRSITGGKEFHADDLEDILQTIINQSKQPIDKKNYYSWLILGIALALYIIELFIRKIIENNKRNKTAVAQIRI